MLTGTQTHRNAHTDLDYLVVMMIMVIYSHHQPTVLSAALAAGVVFLSMHGLYFEKIPTFAPCLLKSRQAN